MWARGELEEVDFRLSTSPSGANYGWRCKEGNQDYSSDAHCASETFVAPILVYEPWAEKMCRDRRLSLSRHALPIPRSSIYFYADYCNGQIWAATQSGATWTPTDLLDTTALISAFGEDEDGELYLADRSSGRIYHIAAPSFFVYLPLVKR